MTRWTCREKKSRAFPNPNPKLSLRRRTDASKRGETMPQANPPDPRPPPTHGKNNSISRKSSCGADGGLRLMEGGEVLFSPIIECPRRTTFKPFWRPTFRFWHLEIPGSNSSSSNSRITISSKFPFMFSNTKNIEIMENSLKLVLDHPKSPRRSELLQECF